MKRMALVVVLSFALAACGPGEMGPPGPAGPPGAQGPQGPKGDPGPAQVVKETKFCSAGISSPLSMILYERISVMMDGSVWTECEVNFPSGGYTGGAFYTSQQAGAQQQSCLVAVDLDASRSYGFFTFKRAAGASTATATYTDDGSAYNGTSYTLTCI